MTRPPPEVTAPEAFVEKATAGTRQASTAAKAASEKFFDRLGFISFQTPTELAGGLALKELRYGAVIASDSPLGERSPVGSSAPSLGKEGFGYSWAQYKQTLRQRK
jgi:hypothetical protein